MTDQSPSDRPPLLSDLQRLADTIGPADTPHTGNTASLLGAIVKVLEHEGVQVAEELFPAPPESAPDPAAQQAAQAVGAGPEAVSALHELLSRAEAVIGKLEGHAQESPRAAGTPEAGSDASAPATEPAPASEQAIPADVSTTRPDPTAPPVDSTPGPELDRREQ